MTTRKHIHEEIFDADPQTLFALLHTPSAIRQWWGASHLIVDSKPGGVWVGLWGDEDCLSLSPRDACAFSIRRSASCFPTLNILRAADRCHLPPT